MFMPTLMPGGELRARDDNKHLECKCKCGTERVPRLWPLGRVRQVTRLIFSSMTSACQWWREVKFADDADTVGNLSLETGGFVVWTPSEVRYASRSELKLLATLRFSGLCL